MFEPLLENPFALLYMFAFVMVMVWLVKLSASQGKKADMVIDLQNNEYSAGHSIKGTIKLKANSFLKLNNLTVSFNCGQRTRSESGIWNWLPYYQESKKLSEYDQIPPSDTRVFDFEFTVPMEIERFQTKIRDEYLSKDMLKPLAWLYSFGNLVRKQDISWFIACNANGEGFYKLTVEYVVIHDVYIK